MIQTETNILSTSVGAENWLFRRDLLEEVAHVVGVGVEVDVRGPGVCVHDTQAGEGLHPLSAIRCQLIHFFENINCQARVWSPKVQSQSLKADPNLVGTLGPHNSPRDAFQKK